MSFAEWEEAKAIVRRARCAICGGKGRSLSLHQVKFLSQGETEQQRIERKTGRR